MKKSKILMLSLITCGLFSIVTTGFCAYIIDSSSSKPEPFKVNVPVSQIQFNKINQDFLTLKSNQITQNITYSVDDIIINDKLVVPFSFDRSKYINSQNIDTRIANNSGILIDLSVKDDVLYKHIKSLILYKRNFITYRNSKENLSISYNTDIDYTFKNERNGNLTYQNCFEFNDSTKMFKIHMPIAKNLSNPEFYLIQIDKFTVSGTFNFDIVFDFNLIDDDNLGYTELFKKTNFVDSSGSKLNFNFSLELYK